MAHIIVVDSCRVMREYFRFCTHALRERKVNAGNGGGNKEDNL